MFGSKFVWRFWSQWRVYDTVRQGFNEPKFPLTSVLLLSYKRPPMLFWSFQASSRRAKMGTITLPSFQLPPLCIYPLNYWAKKMGPVMAAWPERCQAAVPSQPFPELFVISHAQSDSQRQMVFKLNGCGRKSGSWLNRPWQRHGTAKAGPQASRVTPAGWQLAGTAQSRPVIPCLSVIFTLFQHNHSEQPGVIALGMMNWAAWLYSAAGRGLTMIWHVALFGFLTEARHRALRRFMVLRQRAFERRLLTDIPSVNYRHYVRSAYL